MELTVIHEEKHFLVAVKPAGLLSEHTENSEQSFADALEKAIDHEVYPVHRLDKQVGGLMVYAKTKAGASKFSQLIQDHEAFQKTYLAVVQGVPEQTAGIFEDLLFKDSQKNKSYVVRRERKGVKKAKLGYTVIDRASYHEKPVSLVKIRLYTGRTHQIRVQFSSRNMPLVGDNRYGSNEKTDIALFAQGLCFQNPFDGKPMCFEAVPHLPIFDIFGDFTCKI